MSEQPTQTTEPESITLGNEPFSQMGEVLAFLAPETPGTPSSEGAEEGAAAPADAGQEPAPAEGTGAAASGTAGAAEPATGVARVPDSGTPATPGGDTGASSDGSAAGALDAESLTEEWGKLSTAFEERQLGLMQQDSLAEVKTEYKEYFDRLQVHPRALVGQEVMSVTGNGKERLRDSADAKEWQEAVKQLLVDEVARRTEQKQDETKGVFSTIHASIDLFRNNADMVPGGRQFDQELVERFFGMAKDYELRSNGKLIGFSVPVQPIINQLRSQLASERAAKSSESPAAPAAKAPHHSSEQARTSEGQWAPQAGISSKAGTSAHVDDSAAGLFDAFLRQNGFSF